MISRITPAALETYSWSKYVSELKQDFLQFRVNDPMQFFFVYEYTFAKGGKGPLFVTGSNLGAYWQRDELKELESDFRHTHMHGTVTLLEDKSTLELNIKRGGIIQNNKHKIEIAFRDIFRAIGRGDSLRVSFKGHKKKMSQPKAGLENPQSIPEKISYLKRKPKELQGILEQLQDRPGFPEETYQSYLKELKLAESRNNIHKVVEWYLKIEELFQELQEE
jgi:hypothetical protein